MQVYIYIFIILIVRAAAGLQNGLRQKWGQMLRVVHVSRQVCVERVHSTVTKCVSIATPTM